MSYQIASATQIGAGVIDIASGLIEPLRAGADAAGRAGLICAENYQDMKRSCFASAFVSAELRGLASYYHKHAPFRNAGACSPISR